MCCFSASVYKIQLEIMRLPVARPKFLYRPMANTGITFVWKMFPMKAYQLVTMFRQKSSELTWTSAFDATAVVAILINLTAMHLEFVPFEVFVYSQGFFFYDTAWYFYAFATYA